MKSCAYADLALGETSTSTVTASSNDIGAPACLTTRNSGRCPRAVALRNWRARDGVAARAARCCGRRNGCILAGSAAGRPRMHVGPGGQAVGCPVL